MSQNPAPGYDAAWGEKQYKMSSGENRLANIKPEGRRGGETNTHLGYTLVQRGRGWASSVKRSIPVSRGKNAEEWQRILSKLNTQTTQKNLVL